MTEYLHPRKLLRRFGLVRHEGEWLEEEKLVSLAHQYRSVCGIYFLISDGRVQYIGQARCVDRRLADHYRDGKRWDLVTVIECDARDLDLVESIYIHKLRPPLNGRRSSNGNLIAPLSEESIYQRRPRTSSTADRWQHLHQAGEAQQQEATA